MRWSWTSVMNVSRLLVARLRGLQLVPERVPVLAQRVDPLGTGPR